MIDVLVPKYLRIGYLPHSECIDHNKSFSNDFFGKKLTIIWDGIYFYTGKASSREFQRSTYSGQKECQLVMFMSLNLANGYCLDTLGPIFGTTNEATIANHTIATKNALTR